MLYEFPSVSPMVQTVVASWDLQQAKAEDNRDTHPLPPAHFEIPNNLLRQKQDGDIRYQLDASGCHLQLVQIEALAGRLDSDIPDCAMGNALQIQGDYNANPRGNLNKYHYHASPPEISFGSVA